MFLEGELHFVRSIAYQTIDGRHTIPECSHSRLRLVLYLSTELLNSERLLAEVAHTTSRIEIIQVVRAVIVPTDDMVYLQSSIANFRPQ